MPGIHRHSDSRICGATTQVAGQSNVYAENLLVSVNGDPNSHGGGGLIAIDNGVYVNNILVVNHTPTSAAADTKCKKEGPPHCNPMTAQGSSTVFVG